MRDSSRIFDLVAEQPTPIRSSGGKIDQIRDWLKTPVAPDDSCPVRLTRCGAPIDFHPRLLVLDAKVNYPSNSPFNCIRRHYVPSQDVHLVV